MLQGYMRNIDVFGDQLSMMLHDLEIAQGCRDLAIDHICLRLKDPVHVCQVREDLGGIGQEVSCESANGRDIMIFQLDTPLALMSWKIYGVELPFPKSIHKYEDGWEHVEFVLPEAESTMDSLKHVFFDRFNNLTIDSLMAAYEYSEDMPEADGDQLPNPTISIEANGIGVKFHAKSIQEIVA